MEKQKQDKSCEKNIYAKNVYIIHTFFIFLMKQSYNRCFLEVAMKVLRNMVLKKCMIPAQAYMKITTRTQSQKIIYR